MLDVLGMLPILPEIELQRRRTGAKNIENHGMPAMDSLVKANAVWHAVMYAAQGLIAVCERACRDDIVVDAAGGRQASVRIVHPPPPPSMLLPLARNAPPPLLDCHSSALLYVVG